MNSLLEAAGVWDSFCVSEKSTQAKNMKGKNLQCCGLVTELRREITETKELFCVGASFPSVTPPIVWDQGNFYLIIFFFFFPHIHVVLLILLRNSLERNFNLIAACHLPGKYDCFYLEGKIPFVFLCRHTH